MKDELHLKIMFYLTAIVLILVNIITLMHKSYEFLYYAVAITILFIIFVLNYHKLKVSVEILWALLAFGTLHLCGGLLYFGGIRLYDIWLLPHVIRYDNFIHFLGSFIIVIVMYELLEKFIPKFKEYQSFYLGALLILIALGFGALNEILEFGAVVFFDATGVGDYRNNALDLVFNLLGATAASIVVLRKLKKESKIYTREEQKKLKSRKN